MTRGRIAVVTPEGKIMTSAEFNGDMYFDGHGQDVYDDLECVETVEEAGVNPKSFKCCRGIRT